MKCISNFFKKIVNKIQHAVSYIAILIFYAKIIASMDLQYNGYIKGFTL